jgi:hypothetical protein
MRQCQVPDCGRPATRGEDWKQPPLDPVIEYRRGMGLSVSVQDIAVTLCLCDDHATALVDSAWVPVNALLEDWGWTPTTG